MLTHEFEKTMPLSQLCQSYGAANTCVGISLDNRGEAQALTLNGEDMKMGQVAPADTVAINDATLGIPGLR